MVIAPLQSEGTEAGRRKKLIRGHSCWRRKDTGAQFPQAGSGHGLFLVGESFLILQD